MKSFYLAALAALVAAPSFASQNGANDYLMTLTPKGRAEMLGKVIGDGCKGKTVFYMGSMDDSAHEHPPLSGHEHDAFWSARCTNGKSYMVEVHPTGDGQILECSALEALHAGHCFQKLYLISASSPS
jgi:hypothetical protein